MRLHLMFDADDTLWENNVYFDRAFAGFVDVLAHSTLSPSEVRDVLDDIERINTKTHGYGSSNFGRNLVQCYERLVERAVSEDDVQVVLALAEQILSHPLELIDGVPETLADLATRHELVIFTKGHPDEQEDKIARSGLSGLFTHTSVVHEKNADAYRSYVTTRGLDPSRVWMIGNSPRSDVNPALDAGLNAVFVPHARTWVLEHEEVRTGPGRLLKVDRFTRLREYF
jgi:putative hydrolase of the HAD superfamily